MTMRSSGHAGAGIAALAFAVVVGWTVWGAPALPFPVQL